MTSPSDSVAPISIRLCGVDDILEGEAVKVEHGDNAYAVYNVAGSFYVTDDLCTHGPGSLSEGELFDDIIECNFHGGQFNVRTGAVAGPPCLVPVKTYKVNVDNGSIFIEA